MNRSPADTITIGQRVRVQVGSQYMAGRMRRGWYVGTVTGIREHAALGTRIDVRTSFATLDCCDPACVRAR